MDTRRAEAFSDGVFAVAITVLVFGLLPIGTGSHVTKALLRAWPQYVAYVVSFLTIGIMWLNHHTLMAQMRRVNRPLLVLNLLLLMGVVAVPFPTALVADHLTGSQAAGGPAATVTYGLVMIAISVAFSAMWLYVGNHASEVAHRPDRPPPRRTNLRVRGQLVRRQQRDYGVGAGAGRVGSQMRTRVPWPSQDSSVACPPWAVAIACTIDSPSPLPPPSE